MPTEGEFLKYGYFAIGISKSDFHGAKNTNEQPKLLGLVS